MADVASNESLDSNESGLKNHEDFRSDLIGDRYQVLEILGRGGMGTVLKARHKTLGKLVAVKVLNASFLVDDISRKRFEQEGLASGALSHPNLINVFDHGFTPAGEPFLVMEYLDGEALDAILQRGGPLDLPEFLDTFIQVSRALQFIHEKNIVHRDIKASNIMVQTIDDMRYIKLLDFGIAKMLGDDGLTAQHLTTTGTVFGSPPYMSPEQCRGIKTDARSDIYSLGCVMYECASGAPPLRGENSLQTLFMHVHDEPQPLKTPSDNPHWRQVAAVVHKCLVKDPTLRLQNADELLAALSGIGKDSDPRNSMIGEQLLKKPASEPASPPPISVSAHPIQTNSLLAARGSHTSEVRPSVSSGGDGNAHRLRQGMGRDLRPGSAVPGGPKTTAILVAGAIVVVGLCVFSPAGGYFQRSFQKLIAGVDKYQADQDFKAGTDHWTDAEPKYLEALKNTGNSDKDARGQIYARLGKINLQKSRYAEAEKYFRQSIACLQPHSDSHQDDYLDALSGAAEALHKMERYAKADENFVEAANFATKKDDLARLGDIYVSSAKNEQDHGIGGKALRYYDEAVNAYGRLEDKPADKLASALLDSAKLCEQTGDLAEAQNRAQRASDMAANIGTAAIKSSIQQQADAIVERTKSAVMPGASTTPISESAPSIPTGAAPFAVPGIPAGVDPELLARIKKNNEALGNTLDQNYADVNRRMQQMRNAYNNQNH